MPNSKLSDIHNQILEIDLTLDTEIATTMWISDLHGEGRRFVSILRGRFGLIYRTCKEALPTLNEAGINYLSRVIRKKAYITDSDVPMGRREVVLYLVSVLKYKIRRHTHRLHEITDKNMRVLITRLVFDDSVPEIVFEESDILDTLIHKIGLLIMQYALDHLVVLGDILDRGGEPDKIIRILNSEKIRDDLTLIYGNHDLLWMGACAGSRSLIAEALRVTCRYEHMDFLSRMKIDIEKLKAFALKTYPPETITGNFKAKTPVIRSMEKALAVMQFKLEEATIMQFPELNLSHRLWLEKFSRRLQQGDTVGITDTHFPTLDPDNPLKLSEGEREIIDDLTRQFTHNKKLNYYIGFFFRKGKLYHVYNNILNIHALIPSTENGEFDVLFGKKGKALLDYLDETVRRVGEQYLRGVPRQESDLALFLYLWCGSKSPLFGKDSMKTFERYFLSDKTTHKESILYWEKNLRKPEFQQLIRDEFNAKRVTFGHVPKDINKGQGMAIGDGFAINVDGGFAAAYFHRGHALIQTPRQLYGIILPTPEELNYAYKNNVSAPIRVEIVKDYAYPQKIKDTARGETLRKKRENLRRQLSGSP